MFLCLSFSISSALMRLWLASASFLRLDARLLWSASAALCLSSATLCLRLRTSCCCRIRSSSAFIAATRSSDLRSSLLTRDSSCSFRCCLSPESCASTRRSFSSNVMRIFRFSSSACATLLSSWSISWSSAFTSASLPFTSTSSAFARCSSATECARASFSVRASSRIICSFSRMLRPSSPSCASYSRLAASNATLRSRASLSSMSITCLICARSCSASDTASSDAAAEPPRACAPPSGAAEAPAASAPASSPSSSSSSMTTSSSLSTAIAAGLCSTARAPRPTACGDAPAAFPGVVWNTVGWWPALPAAAALS